MTLNNTTEGTELEYLKLDLVYQQVSGYGLCWGSGVKRGSQLQGSLSRVQRVNPHGYIMLRMAGHTLL